MNDALCGIADIWSLFHDLKIQHLAQVLCACKSLCRIYGTGHGLEQSHCGILGF